MRISDWSSDVCSSDLGRADRHATQVGGGERECSPDSGQWQGGLTTWPGTCVLGRSPMTISAFRLGGAHFPQTPRRLSNRSRWPPTRVAAGIADGGSASRRAGHRSEEHTSELQSLMRISYAVFCLKKKTIQYVTI